MDAYQQIIHRTRYSRWMEDKRKRETWEETVERFMDFLSRKASLSTGDLLDIKENVLNLNVMPSMRLLMTAGEAVEKDNIAAYNCSYLAINSKRKFSEALYILMNGTGVGFSCERQEINKLPSIPSELKESDDIIVVADSKLGWAKAFRKLLSSLWEGDIPKIDYTRIRRQGTRLKTFGGRASGPEPLQRLFQYCISLFNEAKGRKLTSIEVHDILCMIGEIVVVGGVRRAALISLSNLTDRRMREAKSGQWWIENPQRALSNNSVVYTEKPDAEAFIEEWLSLVKSKSGERGIFNRLAAQSQANKYLRRPKEENYGCNPCSEIILKDSQFCNLTEVVIRAEDSIETVREKIRIATILGTFQATLTNFNFVSEDWKKNTEEERLLGVSLTGIYDNKFFSTNSEELKKVLTELREYSREVNKTYAARFCINESAAITCIKPSGTVSQLCNSSSGIHPRYDKHYIRTIRIDKKDPVYQFLKEQGFKVEDEITHPQQTAVFYFPVSSPDTCITRTDINAIDHLELWKLYAEYWCEHKPSVTISVKKTEWLSVGAWVFENFDLVSGISFLPYSDHTYVQSPYMECTPEEWKTLENSTPKDIHWELLEKIEVEDNTTSSQELACIGNNCEI